MTARTAGMVLFALAALAAVGVLALGSVHDRWDPVLVAVAGLGVLGSAVAVRRDGRRRRETVHRP